MPKWLLVLSHIVVVAAGVAGSVLTGNPSIGGLTGAINALIPSPIAQKAIPAWGISVLHVLVIVGGVVTSIHTGNPAVGGAAGAINALLATPLAQKK